MTLAQLLALVAAAEPRQSSQATPALQRYSSPAEALALAKMRFS